MSSKKHWKRLARELTAEVTKLSLECDARQRDNLLLADEVMTLDAELITIAARTDKANDEFNRLVGELHEQNFQVLIHVKGTVDTTMEFMDRMKAKDKKKVVRKS